MKISKRAFSIFPARCGLFALLISINGLSQAAQVVGVDATAELPNLIAKNNESRSKIGAISYHVELQVDDYLPIGGRRHFSAYIDAVEKGGSRAISRHTVSKFLDSGDAAQETDIRAVLTPDLFAWVFGGGGTVTRYIIDSNAELSDRAKGDLASYGGPDILAYGFGDGQTMISNIAIDSPARSTRWKATKISNSDSTVEYVLTLSRVSDGVESSVMEWVVDPYKGYLVTRAILYLDAKAIQETEMTPTQLTAGIFVTNQAVTKRFYGRLSDDAWKQRGLSGRDDPTETEIYTFTNIQLDPRNAEKNFDLSFLHAHDGAVVSESATDGSKMAGAMVSGKVMDADLAADAIHQQLLTPSTENDPGAAIANNLGNSSTKPADLANSSPHFTVAGSNSSVLQPFVYGAVVVALAVGIVAALVAIRWKRLPD